MPPMREPGAPNGRRPVATPALPCALSLLVAACAPQAIDVNAPFVVPSLLSRVSLEQQMPRALLLSVGGQLPDVWPAAAPRLIADLRVLSRVRVDLDSAGIDPSRYSSVRLKAVVATVGLASDPLLPQPTELAMWVGPAGATSTLSPGVSPLASGAWPMTPPDGGCGAVAGCAAGADGGSSTAQSLTLEPGGRGALQALVLGAGAFELLLEVHQPIDSAADPLAPRGEASVDVDLSLELAR
jgi:hypothetical protein